MTTASIRRQTCHVIADDIPSIGGGLISVVCSGATLAIHERFERSQPDHGCTKDDEHDLPLRSLLMDIAAAKAVHEAIGAWITGIEVED